MSEPWSGDLREGQIVVLTRELPVRVVNVSAGGCLIETSRRVEVGTLATVRIAVNGESFADEVRVVRCQAVAGGSSYHVGVQFTWTAIPHRRALRRLAEGDTIDAGGQLMARRPPS